MREHGGCWIEDLSNTCGAVQHWTDGAPCQARTFFRHPVELAVWHVVTDLVPAVVSEEQLLAQRVEVETHSVAHACRGEGRATAGRHGMLGVTTMSYKRACFACIACRRCSPLRQRFHLAPPV